MQRMNQPFGAGLEYDDSYVVLTTVEEPVCAQFQASDLVEGMVVRLASQQSRKQS